MRKFIFILLLFLITFSAGAGVYLWLFKDLPVIQNFSQYKVEPSIRITDRNDRPLYEILPDGSGRHRYVGIESIPMELQLATVSTEDASFYTNPGLDLKGIIRAVWINLQGGETVSGGSTITQQVARNLLLSPEERFERSIRRKLRETILAWKITQEYSKDKILELYLNQMNYGAMAYGVEAASQTYFAKSVSDLDLAESALIAGLTQAPGLYNPYTDPEAAKKRQEVVLELMEKHGMIDAEQRVLAAAEKLIYTSTPYPIESPHFVMMVQSQLDAAIPEDVLRSTQGITVRTTLDLDWQRHAETIARRQLEALNNPPAGEVSHNVHNAALVALDPVSGEVFAMLGSPDYFNAAISGAVNMATSPVQPGSALKPLIYAAAFDPDREEPWDPATMILDVRTAFSTHSGVPYVPVNYDTRHHGPVLARDALGSSLNIPAVTALNHVGLEEMIALSKELGITTLKNPREYDLSLALGGGAVELIELTAAYGAFANGGYQVTPTIILDVRDANGDTLYIPQHHPRPKVLDERVAWLITDILSDDRARATGFGLNSALKLDRPAAAKTGTTTDFHDNWTIGYTPDLVVGVWVGNASHEPMRDVSGITGAGPIWHQFMRTVLAGTQEQAFKRPEGLIQVEVCSLSGLLP
ncbi:MAG: PBP1A family penicillin-binding protein, partial [Chloroflexi bacterium]